MKNPTDFKIARKKVEQYFNLHYGVSLSDLEITETPGYWRDKKAKIHPGHPLHGCLFCEGPFKATYYYSDSGRCCKTGKFLSPHRTWRILKTVEN